mmetsp:Transcript_34215/g.47765  ORF Transcript_34215/g.47765 Transcript_34215/m.47765 type:complete len:333 (-) Transcript_34215:120-1118(-)
MGMGGYPRGLPWLLGSIALCFHRKLQPADAAATEMLTIQIGPSPKRFQLDHTTVVPKRMEEYACTSLDGPECYLIDGGKKKKEANNDFIEKISSLIGDALEKTVGVGKKKTKKKKKKKKKLGLSEGVRGATDRENENESSGGHSTESSVSIVDAQDKSNFPGLKQQIEESAAGRNTDQEMIAEDDDEDDEEEEEDDIEHLNGAEIADALAKKLSSIIGGNQLDGVQHIQSFRILPNGETEQISTGDLEDMLSGLQKENNDDEEDADVDDDDEEDDDERGENDEDEDKMHKLTQNIDQLGELLNHLAMNGIGEHSIILDQDGQDEDEEDDEND